MEDYEFPPPLSEDEFPSPGAPPKPAQEYVQPSWAPIDLTGHLDGTYQALSPSVMARTDGNHLLYRGMVHSFQGESESGKSMVSQAEVARQLRRGNRCLYVDFESDPVTIVNRLLMLGATKDDIRGNLHYVNPESNPAMFSEESYAWEQLLKTRYTLAVIDGVTEAFAVFGVKSIDNDEVTVWGRTVPRRLASRTGAAVVVIDHVTKSSEGRGRFAIGAQAKMSYLTGASYMVEVVSPIGVGMSGKLALRVAKDRPGQVRPISGEWRKSDRTQETAVVTIDSTHEGEIRYAVNPPRHVDNGRHDELMERISEVIEQAPTPPTVRTILKMVKGTQEAVRLALDTLIEEGFIRVEAGPRNSQRHLLIKPYREHPSPELFAA